MTAKAGAPDGRTAYKVDELLIQARSALPRRPSPAEALAARATGALLIDIRGDDQRRTCGLIPGALLLPRNALEWRCDPTSQWRHPAVNGWNQHLILAPSARWAAPDTRTHKTPASMFPQARGMHSNGLRSRERRFESCRGHSNPASEVIPLGC